MDRETLFSTSSGDRPAVWIGVSRSVPREWMEPVLWGLEEEGVPAEIREYAEGSAEELARREAQRSPLEVGIGVEGRGKGIALYHRDLIRFGPLFFFEGSELDPGGLRRLGKNAARLVKRQPLDFGEECSAPDVPAAGGERDPERVMKRIIAEILNHI